MKTKKLMLGITMVMVAVGFTAFGQETKKITKAKKDVAEAKKDVAKAEKNLRLAKADSVEDYQRFRKDAEMKIHENEKKIAELKAKKANDNKEVKEKYDKKVASIEQKNNELKMKLNGSSETKTTAWTSFKQEFNHDMVEIGSAIKDIGVDNTK